MTNIEIKTKEMYPDLCNSEKRVADFILGNISSVLRLSLEELAEEAKVSHASIVRFSKSIGYSGFKELKKSIIYDFNSLAFENHSADQHTDIKNKDNIEAIKSFIKHNSIQSIEDTMRLLDEKVISEVVSRLITARSIKVFGVGASGTVAEDFYYKLLRIGKNVCMTKDLLIQLTYASTMTEEDVAVIFSYSGLTLDMIELLEIAKKTGATTVAVTKYTKNDFTRNADYVIYTSAPEIELRSGAMVSRTAQLMVVDVLFTAIASQDYENIKPNLQKSYDSCRSHKKSKTRKDKNPHRTYKVEPLSRTAKKNL